MQYYRCCTRLTQTSLVHNLLSQSKGKVVYQSPDFLYPQRIYLVSQRKLHLRRVVGEGLIYSTSLLSS